jgi:hypothetical protein
VTYELTTLNAKPETYKVHHSQIKAWIEPHPYLAGHATFRELMDLYNQNTAVTYLSEHNYSDCQMTWFTGTSSSEFSGFLDSESEDSNHKCGSPGVNFNEVQLLRKNKESKQQISKSMLKPGKRMHSTPVHNTAPSLLVPLSPVTAAGVKEKSMLGKEIISAHGELQCRVFSAEQDKLLLEVSEQLNDGLCLIEELTENYTVTCQNMDPPERSKSSEESYRVSFPFHLVSSEDEHEGEGVDVPVLVVKQHEEPQNAVTPSAVGDVDGFSGFNTPSQTGAVAKLAAARNRLSLSPLRHYIRETRLIVEECRRRSRSRLYAYRRERLSDLPTTELINNAITFSGTPCSGYYLRPQTRSMGPCPLYTNVQGRILEYDT